MKIVLAGGAGFIGSHVVDAYVAADEVYHFAGWPSKIEGITHPGVEVGGADRVTQQALEGGLALGREGIDPPLRPVALLLLGVRHPPLLLHFVK